MHFIIPISNQVVINYNLDKNWKTNYYSYKVNPKHRSVIEIFVGVNERTTRIKSSLDNISRNCSMLYYLIFEFFFGQYDFKRRYDSTAMVYNRCGVSVLEECRHKSVNNFISMYSYI